MRRHQCSAIDCDWLLGWERADKEGAGRRGGGGRENYGGTSTAERLEIDETGLIVHKNVTLTRKSDHVEFGLEKAKEREKAKVAKKGGGRGDKVWSISSAVVPENRL